MELEGDLRIAVDIGGTFTDCVILDHGGQRLVTKSLTTPENPAQGVLDCIDLAARKLDVDPSGILNRTVTFVHGTTVGTNALVERRGARTGLLMTRGHEESVTIGRVRQKVAGLSEREKTHITHLKKAQPPIVAPQDVRGVTERIDVTGAVVVELNEAEAISAADELVGQGVDAIAICLLWSFLNPEHEERLRNAITDRHPDLYVTASIDVAPVLGEYERAVSTIFNAYLGPRVGGYLRLLEDELRKLGMPSSLLVMQANGGLGTVDDVSARPLLTVDSGPAGGVLGTRYHAELLEATNAICADVGGTTFDVGIVFDGQTQMDPAPVIDQYAYMVPKVYVKSIGAGGGSIAWIDRANSLRVGPRSAGSVPGPACYGRGGTEPTVTDAHLLLGYLDPDTRLGGQVQLDADAAERALATVGDGVGLSAVDVAAAIAEISSAQMADLTRKVTIERGLDPREFSVFAYGGAGPVFAASLARQIGSRTAYVPADSGVFSALGMLTTDMLFQEERAAIKRTPLDQADVADINDLYSSLEQRVLERFGRENYPAEEVKISRTMDMRFAMQVHELSIDITSDSLTADDIDRTTERFVETYERTYGQGSAYTAAGVEIVKFTVSGVIPLERPTFKKSGAAEEERSRVGERKALFDSREGFVTTAVHDGRLLAEGQQLFGPAVVQRQVDTVLIPPGAQAQVDDLGSIIIDWGEGREQ